MAEPVAEQYGGGGEAGQPIGMRLNQYPAEPGGPPGPVFGGQRDFGSSPAQKKAAAKAIEDHIEPDTLKAGDRVRRLGRSGPSRVRPHLRPGRAGRPAG